MTKQEFIGKYLDKHMKGHGLPMSIQYYSLLGDTEEKAKLAWKRHRKYKNKKYEQSK